MYPLTPFEQALDADTALVAADPFGPGSDVLLRTEDGVEHPMRGLFEQVGADTAPGSALAKVITGVPMLHIQASAIHKVLGRPLVNTDRFIIRGQVYRPQAPVQDGFGMVPIKLQEIRDVKP